MRNSQGPQFKEESHTWTDFTSSSLLGSHGEIPETSPGCSGMERGKSIIMKYIQGLLCDKCLVSGKKSFPEPYSRWWNHIPPTLALCNLSVLSKREKVILVEKYLWKFESRDWDLQITKVYKILPFPQLTTTTEVQYNNRGLQMEDWIDTDICKNTVLGEFQSK